MAIRIVTYDLGYERKKTSDYQQILKVIKQGAWARLSESSYAMDTYLSPSEIFQQLKPHLDGNDSLLILTLTGPWYGQHSQEVRDWLKSRLPL